MLGIRPALCICSARMRNSGKENAKMKSLVKRVLKSISQHIKGDTDERLFRLSKDVQDIKSALIRLTPLIDKQYKLITDSPVAVNSWDHKQPRGTLNDDTRCPQFVYKTEAFFGRKVRACDLGCAGGGLVFDFLVNGNYAVGVEGSDLNRRLSRAHWGVIPNHLFVADITKPFEFRDPRSNIGSFDVITAWEVMEHIPEQLIRPLVENVKKHLDKSGIFVCSIATFPDHDPRTGAMWHVTLKSREWWIETLRKNGLVESDAQPYELGDFARGSGNPYASDWNAATNPELGFHLVLKNSGS